MDLTDLYSTYDRINSLSPRTLLKIVLYSYMNGDYSFRSMELNCKRDINFMFLLEGHSAPDHATLARFRSIHFAPCSKRILAEVSRLRQMPINILSCGKQPLQKIRQNLLYSTNTIITFHSCQSLNLCNIALE